MKLAAIIFSIVVFFVSSSVLSAQTVNTARIKLKGIGLDSTYSQVIKALGKPETDEAPKDEACIGGKEKSVKYPGLSFYLMDGDSKDKKTFEVKAFELTASNMLVSGIKIGDTPATVKKVYGRKYRVDTDREAGEITWFYEMGDRLGPGTTRVVFKNGKVSMIASDFQVC